MNKSALLLILMLVATVAQGAIVHQGSVGHGEGILAPARPDSPCPSGLLCLNFDGSIENGYCWQYLFGLPPFGAFAECCNPCCPACVCGIELLLTSTGAPCPPCDLYLWNDSGGIPGDVLSVTTGVNPCPVATWPNVSTHDFAISPVQTCGRIWCGYWADFSQQPCGYFIAADTNGFGGCPMTYVPPDIGPGGWCDVSIFWGPTQSIGIGLWYVPSECTPVPVEEGAWGRVKQMYR